MLKLIKILSIVCFFAMCAAAQQQKQRNITEPLKILSKPSVSYTNEARRDEIKGVVRLKITFKSNGQIGKIEDVTEKDKEIMTRYGLTASAFEAARKIKFVPAKRNGRAVSVTKLVVYEFTLF